MSSRAERRRQRRSKRNGGGAHHAFKPAAPFLHKERVVLEDVLTLDSGSTAGYAFAQLSANGAIVNGTGSFVVPQARLWN